MNLIEYLYPLGGGLLIGMASSLMLFALGRITGISGILGNIFDYGLKENSWRILFIAGLICGGVLGRNFFPEFFNTKFNPSLPQTILAGLLVGFGTRLGSGCTSGHGVCGIPRLSKRSIVATIIFITVGILTVTFKGKIG